MEKVTTFFRRKMLPPDDTRAWMSFVNPGMLDPGNVYLFDYCIRHLPSNAPIVEIGSFCGLSLNHISYFLRKYGCPNLLFSSDAWEFEGFTRGAEFLDGTELGAIPYQQHVIETFRTNVSFFSGDRLPYHIRLASDAFFQSWEECEEVTDFFGRTIKLGGAISLAYIDGDHSYEQSRRDFVNVDRHLQVGGFVIFDDSADWTDWGSHRAAREVALLPNYEIVHRAPNYCLRKTAVS